MSVLSCHHFTPILHKSQQLNRRMAGKNSLFENSLPACSPDTTRLKVLGDRSLHRPWGQGERWDGPFTSFILPIPAGPSALEVAEGLPSPSSWNTFCLQRVLNQSPAKGIKLCPPREHPAKVVAGQREYQHATWQQILV